MNNNYQQRDGFSIMEVLVSLAVLVLVIFSATSLVVSIIRSNNENIDTLIAYGLAQEGIEGFRNVRDSNWLLGANYVGELGRSSKTPVWGVKLSEVSGASNYYTIDLSQLERFGDVTEASSMPSHTPWLLDQHSFGSEDQAKSSSDTLIKKYKDLSKNEVRYGHSLLGSSEDTRFHRYLMVENNSKDPLEVSSYKVTCVVAWEEQNRPKEVRLSTELTDWNQGQL